MGKLIFAESAWEEYLYWQANDKKTIFWNCHADMQHFRGFCNCLY